MTVRGHSRIKKKHSFSKFFTVFHFWSDLKKKQCIATAMEKNSSLGQDFMFLHRSCCILAAQRDNKLFWTMISWRALTKARTTMPSVAWKKSCKSYITFRAEPPYTSAVTISHLLGAQPDLIFSLRLNNLSMHHQSLQIPGLCST